MIKGTFPNSKVNFDDAVETNFSIEEFLTQLVKLYNKNKFFFTSDFELFMIKSKIN